jgi:hypothetical protein
MAHGHLSRGFPSLPRGGQCDFRSTRRLRSWQTEYAELEVEGQKAAATKRMTEVTGADDVRPAVLDAPAPPDGQPAVGGQPGEVAQRAIHREISGASHCKGAWLNRGGFEVSPGDVPCVADLAGSQERGVDAQRLQSPRISSCA